MTTSRGTPPERFHVFASYTTREEEVQIVKPIVDHFLNIVLRPVIERTIGEPPVFYDGYTLRRAPWFERFPIMLEPVLRFAIEESEILMAFLSPEYLTSHWCVFECKEMATKELRPWFDLCRKAPIDELQDRRPAGRRPGWLMCRWARIRMRRWRRRRQSRKPGGVIVPVCYEGDLNIVNELPEVKGLHVRDWTACPRAAAAHERVWRHRSRHGSVSPSWESDAALLDRECGRAMRDTGEAVVEILERRREIYAQWQP